MKNSKMSKQSADHGQVKTVVNKNRLHKQNIGNGFDQGMGARSKSTPNDKK